ncbi:hypothetical protein FQA39_LY06333 [Lamprigera yunnana]|nr:hypothetical protein FQA39_LY06333 [Lamprigera yunnana]
MLESQLTMQKDDLTLYGAPAPTRLNRAYSVRRTSTISSYKDFAEPFRTSVDDTVVNLKSEQISERYRKSLDSTYRHSLESISEHKPKHSFSTTSLIMRNGRSIESTSSDYTDYAVRSTTDVTNDEKTSAITSSNYLSWIENVNSECFGSTDAAAVVEDADAKVGEWNNFWLNYNSATNRYISSPYLCPSNENKTGDDISDDKSTPSTQREFTEKQFSTDQIYLSHDEIQEAIKCSQRITEILEQALKRNNNETDECKSSSYYSQPLSFLFSTFRQPKEEVQKERARSYSLEPQQLQRQKQSLKPPSGSSCINVLFNSGVADILKKVINKRRDMMAPDEQSNTSRSSFSDWSSTK